MESTSENSSLTTGPSTPAGNWSCTSTIFLRRRKLDEDALVLGAEEIDLGDARHLEQPLTHAFGGLLELGVVGAVAGHHVENGVDVGELVIDDGTEHARRQLVLHVNDLLTQAKTRRRCARPGCRRDRPW